MEHDSADIARRVKSGEYFREARQVYSALYEDPMSERYFYAGLCAASILLLVMSLIALALVFPLRQSIPFIYLSEDMVNTVPVMKPISQPGETPNMALKRFFLTQYVDKRESYDIDTLEVNVRGVKSESSPEVFAAFEKTLDPSNAESPISLYQRHSKRKINVRGMRELAPGEMEVTFDATVETQGEKKRSSWVATVAFSYTDATIDQSSGATQPLQFQVTGYRVHRLQD